MNNVASITQEDITLQQTQENLVSGHTPQTFQNQLEELQNTVETTSGEHTEKAGQVLPDAGLQLYSENNDVANVVVNSLESENNINQEAAAHFAPVEDKLVIDHESVSADVCGEVKNELPAEESIESSHIVHQGVRDDEGDRGKEEETTVSVVGEGVVDALATGDPPLDQVSSYYLLLLLRPWRDQKKNV